MIFVLLFYAWNISNSGERCAAAWVPFLTGLARNQKSGIIDGHHEMSLADILFSPLWTTIKVFINRWAFLLGKERNGCLALWIFRYNKGTLFASFGFGKRPPWDVTLDNSKHFRITYIFPIYVLFWSGLRSRSRHRSWSRSESTVLPGVGVGAGISKILPTLTPARSRKIPSVNRQWLRTNGYVSSRKHWKTWRKGDWQRGDKVETLFSDWIPPDKRYRI